MEAQIDEKIGQESCPYKYKYPESATVLHQETVKDRQRKLTFSCSIS